METLAAACIDKDDFLGIEVLGNELNVYPRAIRFAAERRRRRCRPLFGDGMAGGDPCLPTAVENRHLLVSDPPQHPPQARGVGAAGLVVADDQTGFEDAHATQPVHERVRVGQRMTTVAAAKLPRKILVHMRETGARDVRLGVGRGSEFGIGQFVTAVKDH